eukprot:4341804-Karenia_brevis.AAC.1
MFKLWTNAGKRKAVQNPTRQFTDEEVADLIRDMVAGSEGNAWMMLRNVPKKSVLLANPMDAASKYQ